MKKEMFFLNKGETEKSSYIWNTFGSMLMAFQSVIMLIIITRTQGLLEAGIFTIAYANANLFLTIGKYGMRNYQVSDVTNKFSFDDYRTSRVITSVAMIFVSCTYIIYVSSQNNYTKEKSMIILFMCLFKLVDVIEDVYHGLYQQKGRLDIAAKALTLRLIITIIVFGFSLIISKNLLKSLSITTFVTTIVFIMFTWIINHSMTLEIKERYNIKNALKLLKNCFPLFLGNFLSFYIGNAPKYSIDTILSDKQQACYGFISMPVFVIGLLNGFIFSPMIYRIAILWRERKMKEFNKLIKRQLCIIVILTSLCIVGAYAIGVPVLSIIYNTNLAPYKNELLVLLLGGGFLALSGFLVTIITILRLQKGLVYGYVLVAAIAYVLSPILVGRYSMMGAAILYTTLMSVLCIIFTVLLRQGMKKEGQ